MTGHENLLRGLVAVCCLAAAACAEMKDQAPERAVTSSEPPQAAAPVETSAGPESATVEPPAAAAATEPTTTTSDTGPSIAGPEPEAPSASTADGSQPPAAESPSVASEPSNGEADAIPASLASALAPPADTLDFESLVTRLRETKAIGLLTKVAVKKQSDDLLEEFRAYHTRHGTATLPDLRRAYDSLFYKLHSLLEDADPPLARDIDRSRTALWEILSDPRKFTHLMSGA